MKRIYIIVLLFFVTMGISAQSTTKYIIAPRKIGELDYIFSAEVLRYDNTIGNFTWPLVEYDGGFCVPTMHYVLQTYSPQLVLSNETKIDTSGLECDAHSRFFTNTITGIIIQWDIDILRYKGATTFKRLYVDQDLVFMTVIGNFFIYRKYSSSLHDEYVGYSLDDNLNLKRYDHDATLAYAVAKIPGMRIVADQLQYYGNSLQPYISGYDDDYNMYFDNPVKIDGKYLEFAYVGEYRYTFFDAEGNAWQVDYYDPTTTHPVLYYAGRDWGYKQAPKKAVTTDSGLRIRLRATTNSYILGTLEKNQNITILKTGATETIGGITAPWYRIKTADGLIGWAFGGYIKVLK